MAELNRRTFLKHSIHPASASAASSLIYFTLYAGMLEPAASVGFIPPAPSAVWEEIPEAVEFSPSAPQRTSGNISQDCLYLNVFTPSVIDHRKRTVLLYSWEYFNGPGFSPCTVKFVNPHEILRKFLHITRHIMRKLS